MLKAIYYNLSHIIDYLDCLYDNCNNNGIKKQLKELKSTHILQKTVRLRVKITFNA